MRTQYVHVASNVPTLHIARCYSKMDIVLSSVSGTAQGIGMFIGYHDDLGFEIVNCFARGSMTAPDSLPVAGFLGVYDSLSTVTRNITTCYCAVDDINGHADSGGFFAQNLDQPPTITDCFWDTSRSPLASDEWAEGSTTSLMMEEETYDNFNFDTVWTFDP